MPDILSQHASCCTRLDHLKARRLSKQLPHLIELAGNGPAPEWMHIAAGEIIPTPAQRLTPVASTSIVAKRRMIERNLHEMCEGDRAGANNLLADQLFQTVRIGCLAAQISSPHKNSI